MKVRYTPTAVETPDADGVEAADAPDDADTKGEILGYPATYIYAAAAAFAGILLLALLFFLIRGRNSNASPATEMAWDDSPANDRTVIGVNEDDAKTQMVAPAAAATVAHAYLHREDDQTKLPINSHRVSIGRGTANAIVINHTSISRVHAELHRNRDGGFSVTDMDSLNGTFVNGSKVSGTMAIRIGDMIKFGEVTTKLILT